MKKKSVKGQTTKLQEATKPEPTPEEIQAREHAFRKEVSEIFVLNVKNLDTGEVLFSRAEVLDVSATGLLLLVQREEIVSMQLRSTLTMNLIHNVSVGFTIEVMDTYIEGTVKRTKAQGRGEFFIAVDFREDAPDYWRESLVDLLPAKDEFLADDEEETEEFIRVVLDEDSDDEPSGGDEQ